MYTIETIEEICDKMDDESMFQFDTKIKLYMNNLVKHNLFLPLIAYINDCNSNNELVDVDKVDTFMFKKMIGCMRATCQSQAFDQYLDLQTDIGIDDTKTILKNLGLKIKIDYDIYRYIATVTDYIYRDLIYGCIIYASENDIKNIDETIIRKVLETDIEWKFIYKIINFQDDK